MSTQTVTLTQTVDNISSDSNGIVAVRYINTYTDSTGKVFQETVAGEYITPGTDYSTKDPKVIAICQVVQTAAVIAAYQAAQTAALSGPITPAT
jgi:hypothetical protein